MNQVAFLRDQFHGMVLQATVQRAHIYATPSTEEQREGFRVALRQQLDALVEVYRMPVDDTVHVRNIAALADHMSRQHGGALRDARFRIGPSQKALNLLLKYHWCVGWIPEPPHCPLDAIVIGLLPSQVRCKWTDLDSIDAYRKLVSAAREVAGKTSLAQWELAAYDRASPAARRGRT